MKKRVFLFIICVSISFWASAQIDSENKSIAIPAIETDMPDEDPEKINEPETKIEMPIAPKPQKSKEEFKMPKKEFSMVQKDKYRSSAELFSGNVSKQMQAIRQQELVNYGSQVNQFLGEFRTSAKKVNIIYRDHMYPDGDLIRVYVNDDIIHPSVLLTSGYNGFFLTLKPGINKIDFLALNQGESGPNTAEFQVIGDNGEVISKNTWNLATGVRASIILTKEENGTLRLGSTEK